MKYPNIFISTLSLLLALSSSQLRADEHEAHEEHGTHEHGVARLSLAVGNEGVDIMLESPAANIVGFEHAPGTSAERQTLASARQKLEAGVDLFNLPADADCTLKTAKVVSGLLGNTDEKPAEAHNDLDVSWSYRCTDPAALTEISIKLFSAFPEGFQKIHAEWVTDQGASALELEKDDTIKLTP